MNDLIKYLTAACLACLLTFGCFWTYLSFKYGQESVRAAKDTLVHADGLVGEARLAAKNSVTASQKTSEAIENLNETITDLDKLVWKFDDSADAATELLSTSGRTIDNVGTAIVNRTNALATTQANADAAIAAITTIPPQVNGTLGAATQAIGSLNHILADPVILDAAGNVNRFAANGADLELSLNTSVKHVDQRWLAPWDGSHPVRHYAGVGLGYVGLGTQIAIAARQ